MILPAFSQDETAENLDSALDEMRALEARIEALLAEEASRNQEIRDLRRDLSFADQFISGSDRLRRRGRRTLETLQRGAEREISVMDSASESGRERLDAAARGIRLTAPLMLHQADRAGPADPRSLALALAHFRHRRDAHLAVDQLLRIEERRAQRVSDRERNADLARRYDQFSGMKIEELRRRHRQLAEELDGSQSRRDGVRSDIAGLDSRKAELNGFIARLTGLDTTSVATSPRPTPTPRSRVASSTEGDTGSDARPIEIASAPDAKPQRASPGDLPELAYEDQSELPLGTRLGNGSPTVTLEIGGATSSTEGDRRLFWRAGASEVFALASGTVLFSGPFTGYRHLLVVDHGGGWVSVIGNLTECSLAEGGRVERGRSVGLYQALDSGRTDPLWVEVRKDAQTVPIESMPGLPADWADRILGPNA